ncbi:MAG: hypothetical protein R3E53_22895 [Myxococcota bacterium]
MLERARDAEEAAVGRPASLVMTVGAQLFSSWPTRTSTRSRG